MEENINYEAPFTPNEAPDNNNNGAPFAAPEAPVKSKKRRIVNTDEKDRVFSLLFLLLSIVGAGLTFWGRFNLGFTVTHTLFFILTSVYAAQGGKTKLTPFPIFCGLTAVAMSAMFALRIDTFIDIALFAAIVCLDCVYFGNLWGTPKYAISEVTMITDVLRRLLHPLRHTILPLRSLPASKEKKTLSFNWRVIIGLLLAFPLAVLLFFLLARSDVAFENLVKNIRFDLTGIAKYVFVGLICFPYLFAFAFTLKNKTDASVKPGKPIPRFVDGTIFNTVLSVVSALYAVYLFSQLSYFISAFSNLLPDDFSHAEYARRGFFEICIIAAINICLVFVSLAAVKTKNGDEKPSLSSKMLCMFICAFTLFLISTAISKMFMYIDNYGMTRLRILTSCFMVFLGVTFITAIIRIFARNFPYMKVLITAAAVILLGISITDIDTYIARYNIDAFESGKIKYAEDIIYDFDNSDPGVYAEMVRLYESDKLKETQRYDLMLCMSNKIYEYYEIDTKKVNGETQFTFTEREITHDFRSFNLEKRRGEAQVKAFVQEHKEDVVEFLKEEYWYY